MCLYGDTDWQKLPFSVLRLREEAENSVSLEAGVGWRLVYIYREKMIDGESQTTNNHVVLKFLETSSSQIKRTYPVKSDELKRRAQKPETP